MDKIKLKASIGATWDADDVLVRIPETNKFVKEGATSDIPHLTEDYLRANKKDWDEVHVVDSLGAMAGTLVKEKNDTPNRQRVGRVTRIGKAKGIKSMCGTVRKIKGRK